jgi:hypothetical protein
LIQNYADYKIVQIFKKSKFENLSNFENISKFENCSNFENCSKSKNVQILKYF